MEYQKADGSWQTFKDNISLGKDGDVTLDLPVYVDGKGIRRLPPPTARWSWFRCIYLYELRGGRV